MTLVKICGISEVEHARVAAEAGASLVGFVFVPVRREVQPDVAQEIVRQVRSEFAMPPAMIGLFVNESADMINRTVADVGLDLVQLHGDEPPELASQLDVPVIKALRLGTGTRAEDVRQTVEQYMETCCGVLVDSHVPGHWGGTGVVGDWETAANIARSFPVALAGGLNADNVQLAIDAVRPAIVDVSSGVETNGRKDSGKVRQFIERARERELPKEYQDDIRDNAF